MLTKLLRNVRYRKLAHKLILKNRLPVSRRKLKVKVTLTNRAAIFSKKNLY
jgi:hypothetical protein